MITSFFGIVYSKRASHHKLMKRPLANILFCLLFNSLLFSSFFVLQFRLEKELNQHRQTLKPLENKGFFRLSLLYRNGTHLRPGVLRLVLIRKFSRKYSVTPMSRLPLTVMCILPWTENEPAWSYCLQTDFSQIFSQHRRKKQTVTIKNPCFFLK